jgi:hypothetical protein
MGARGRVEGEGTEVAGVRWDGGGNRDGKRWHRVRRGEGRRRTRQEGAQ